MPKSPIMRKLPNPERSRFVVSPYRLMAAKVAEVMKKTRTMLTPV